MPAGEGGGATRRSICFLEAAGELLIARKRGGWQKNAESIRRKERKPRLTLSGPLAGQRGA